MQCRWLNVWSVYFHLNTLSCQNYFFQRIQGVYKIVVEIPEGWGYLNGPKKWKFRGGGRAYVKFPPWWGYGYFLELHVKCFCIDKAILFENLSEPSLVLLIHCQNSHPAGSVKITFIYCNSQWEVREFCFCSSGMQPCNDFKVDTSSIMTIFSYCARWIVL